MGVTSIARHPGREAIESLPEDATRAFGERVVGAVVTPDDPEYDDARRVWNGEIDRYPALVVRPTGPADVVECVTFAGEHDLLVAVRGGGHNVAGNATCDGGLVIDCREMNGVRVDPDERTVRVGGGATWFDVDRETQVFGLATPGGAISDTGVAGLTLGGGYGHLRRKHGLSCDSLRSVDVVTADGELRTASEDRNEDLFWAVRGGGGNFGVVTSFEFDCYEVGPAVSVLFTWYPEAMVEDVLRAFREYAEDAPREVSVLPFYAFVPELDDFPEKFRGEPAVALLGAYAGDPDEGDDALRPMRELGEPIVDASGRMDYVDLQQALDEDYPTGRRYYWKAVYVDDLTDEVIDVVESTGAESPSPLSTIDIWQMGGAIADVAPEETAFWHREEPYMVNYEANWDEPGESEANIEWVRDGIEALRELPVASGGYGNFPGFGEDSTRQIYGGNYERLRRVKADYDPENLFRLNQNVEPAE